MARTTRSARGEIVDFELLAIKAQLAAAPVPKAVEQRKVAIDLKDGVKTDVAPDLNMEMFAVASNAAKTSASTGKQITKK